jgi:hypothetical protein
VQRAAGQRQRRALPAEQLGARAAAPSASAAGPAAGRRRPPTVREAPDPASRAETASESRPVSRLRDPTPRCVGVPQRSPSPVANCSIDAIVIVEVAVDRRGRARPAAGG